MIPEGTTLFPESVNSCQMFCDDEPYAYWAGDKGDKGDPFTDFGQKSRPAWEYEVVGNIYNDEDFRKYAQNVLYIKEYNEYKTEKQKEQQE